jgi:hypothetical protein
MKTFTFELTEDEANVILSGLQELPAKVCNPLSQKLVEQAKAQVNPPTGRVIEHSVDENVKTAEELS